MGLSPINEDNPQLAIRDERNKVSHVKLEKNPLSVSRNAPRLRSSAQSILLVENDENELVFMTIALEKAGIASELQVVKAGEQAIAYLSGHDEFVDRSQHPLPVLVFLNLKSSSATGIDLLRWIRDQPKLDTVVVIAWVEPENFSDVALACSLGANSCLAKPSPRIELVEMMELVKRYWLHLNQSAAANLE